MASISDTDVAIISILDECIEGIGKFQFVFGGDVGINFYVLHAYHHRGDGSRSGKVDLDKPFALHMSVNVVRALVLSLGIHLFGLCLIGSWYNRLPCTCVHVSASRFLFGRELSFKAFDRHFECYKLFAECDKCGNVGLLSFLLGPAMFGEGSSA